MISAKRSNWPAFLPPAALLVALFGAVVIAPAGYAPASRESDFYLYYFPLAEAAFEILRGGELPLWNPYIDAGVPFLAAIEIGILYPPNWLHLIVPAERAFCLLYVAHVALAGVGAWLHARGRGRSTVAALFTAQAFACATPTILHHDMGMTSIVYSSAWIPMVFAGVDRCLRRRTLASACLLAVVLACQFLAGFPMFTVMLAVFIPAYLAVLGVDWRRTLGGTNLWNGLVFGIAAMLALGLVAPQLLATWECAANSQRGDLAYEQATQCSFPLPNLLTFLIPEFFGNDKACPYWGEAYLFDADAHCGATTVFLAVIAVLLSRNREVRFWAAAAVVVMAFALARNSWFYDLCFAFVPGVNKFRGVSRLVIFVVYGVAVLAGIGMDSVLSGRYPAKQRMLSLAAGLIATALLAFATPQLLAGKTSPATWQNFVDWVRRPGTELNVLLPEAVAAELPQISYTTMLQGLSGLSAVLLADGLLIGAGRLTAGRQRWRGIGLITLLAAELYAAGGKYVVLTETESQRMIGQHVRLALEGEPGHYRIAGWSRNPPLPHNRFLYGRLQDIGGHENFVPYRYSLFLQYWLDLQPEWQTFLTVPNDHRAYDLLNVRYFVTVPENQWIGPQDELYKEHVFHHGGRNYLLYRNGTALPRVSLIHKAQRAHDLKTAFQLLEHLYAGGPIDSEAVVEGDPGIELEPVADHLRLDEQVTIVEQSSQKLVVDVRCRAPGLLLYCETYYPGWVASVDGNSAPILPANVFMRAVPVAPGDHRVEMSYQPVSLRIGFWLAGVALAVVGMQLASAGWRTLRRRSIQSQRADACGVA